MLPSARRHAALLRPSQVSTSLVGMSKLQRHFVPGYDRTVYPWTLRHWLLDLLNI